MEREMKSFKIHTTTVILTRIAQKPRCGITLREQHIAYIVHGTRRTALVLENIEVTHGFPQRVMVKYVGEGERYVANSLALWDL